MSSTVITPTRGWVPARLSDILSSRELLLFLIWSELKVRYKQTVLGVAWAVFQPLAVMVVFTVFFGIVARVPTGQLPYPIFAYSGLVVWTYFANSLSTASDSLVQHQNLISKVYFPRLLIPIASVVSGLADFAMAFAVLIALIALYGFVPSAALLTLPLFVLLATATALAFSLWLSALNVQYRDVKLLTPVLVQLWFFATPIIYPSNLIPEGWRTLYALNPMAGVIEGFRWALLGKAEAPNLTMVAISALVVLVLLVGGLYYFRRMERIFADVV